MSEDTDLIKKTVDLKPSDKQFVEEEVSNFSALVRRMIGLEKYYRTDTYDMDELENQLRKIVEVGDTVRREWRERQQAVLDEYNAEIEREERQGIAFEMKEEDEGKYTVDWGGNAVEHWKDNKKRTEEAKELGEKLAEQWIDTINEYSSRVKECTDFKHVDGDEFTMYFDGKEDTEMEGLIVGTKYVPTGLGQIDVTMGEAGRNYRAKLLVNYRAVY